MPYEYLYELVQQVNPAELFIIGMIAGWSHNSLKNEIKSVKTELKADFNRETNFLRGDIAELRKEQIRTGERVARLEGHCHFKEELES